jgi:nitroreductase
MKEFIKKVLQIRLVLLCYMSDFKRSVRYSLSAIKNTKLHLQARIILNLHSLEKGLSFKNRKEGWGGEKAYNLAVLVDKYNKTYGVDEISINAINVLNEYLKDSSSSKNDRFVDFIKKVLSTNDTIKDGIGGVKKVSKPSFSISYDQVRDFFASRRSVRDFSNSEITVEEVNNALEIASTTPTACNRQAQRVYSFSDKSKIKSILENQLGDQGWCLKANKMFVITSSVSFYNGTFERHQALVDGGLYAMNFVMGLHAQRIATCFKMYVRKPSIDREFRKLCNIPKDEDPVVLVLAGHYPLEEIQVPYSYRFKEK